MTRAEGPAQRLAFRRFLDFFGEALRTATVNSKVFQLSPAFSFSRSWHFERGPIPYALETDSPVGAAGFEPLCIAKSDLLNFIPPE